MFIFSATRKQVIYFVVLMLVFVICSFIIIFVNFCSSVGKSAHIYINGSFYMAVDLSEDLYREYTIETEHGFNVIAVSEGNVFVVDSDCPDGTCIKTGPVNRAGQPIICLPHKLEIIVSEKTYDGVT